MSDIVLLPEHIVSKIAAGEVIQRPSNVVKELVENAIDAGATRLKIYIENGGHNKIRVIDNGSGMTKEDLALAYLPHTTSKLIDFDDMFKLDSHGFRGEALNSISTVSKTTIASRVASSETGYRITIDFGVAAEVVPMGIPVGTEVTVENLFLNLPARKKFLKSENLEFSFISKVVLTLALVNPKIAIQLFHNTNLVLDLPIHNSVLERLEDTLGSRFSSAFIPIQLSDPHLEIFGYISKPQFSGRGLNYQYLYINNRAVTEKSLLSVLRSSYGNLLEARVNPAFILYFKLAPELVDINVHPRKEEVRIINFGLLNELTQKAVLTSLQQNNLTYIKQGFMEMNSYLLKDKPVATSLKELGKHTNASLSPTAYELANSDLDYENILQIHNMYLVKQSERGVVFYDQHAVHERIIYEQLLKSFKEKNSSTTLPFPEIISLPLDEATLLEEYIPLLSDLGFNLETFGQNTYKIVSVPSLLIDRNISELIMELVSEFSEDINFKTINDKTHLALSHLACRSAIKTGEYLSPSQRQKLLQELDKSKGTIANYTCPHGRPVKVDIPLKELDKIFKRT